jgi:hypothetical protein
VDYIICPKRIVADHGEITDMCNPESIEDLVELLIPELQKRGLYRTEYPVPGGTFRENMQEKPGQPLLGLDHPAAKLRWNAQESSEVTNGKNGHSTKVNGKKTKGTNGVNGLNGHGKRRLSNSGCADPTISKQLRSSILK